ncbi:MAG TPA: SGNH/GDSL hydrolase family protein [Allosphingosinicella sp.]|uniref:SGNH/GDSL hydrolase family protein n=1 Tax=Allosphingosinicella sp. TaxID=2823234 RepID=UPI002EDA54DA
MSHIVLLGDSIFDNAAYVPGGPDVIRQVREELPDWQATLLAVDGAITTGVASQLKRMPEDATHLVVSVGGNDALGASYLLGQSVRNVGEAAAVLEQAQRAFAQDYAEMLEGVLAQELPTAVCTIYDTPQSAQNHRIIRTALAIFNDIITRAAFSRGLPLIDLRLICNEEADYANPIEPSVQGGAKMARAIRAFAEGYGAGQSHVIAGRD